MSHSFVKLVQTVSVIDQKNTQLSESWYLLVSGMTVSLDGYDPGGSDCYQVIP